MQRRPERSRVQLAAILALFSAMTVSFFFGGALGGCPQNEYGSLRRLSCVSVAGRPAASRARPSRSGAGQASAASTHT
jgi:hypothetical protein